MTVLLHISAGPRIARSHSRRYGGLLVGHLARVQGGVEIVRRDLGTAPLPYPDEPFAEANVMPADWRGTKEQAALALSETLVEEVERADLIAIDTPMHNYAVPATLKAWIDYVVRPGRTFRSSPQGKIGLLADRPVHVVFTCAGLIGDAPPAQPDFLTPYLRAIFATIGITSLSTLCLDGLGRGSERADARLAESLGLQAGAALG
jgi:FMN-dependent NADH-azoreductase